MQLQSFPLYSLISLATLLTIASTQTTQWTSKAITEDCLDKSNRHDCAVFNRCCDFRCQQQTGSTTKSHFCMAILGQIVAERTECACSSASSLRGNVMERRHGGGFYPKVEFIGAIALIFVVDLVLLSFSL
uniref:Transmembrane protein n=1 Tax=Panagrellus redivivus TaxID=6233 RepID=A0A7E4UR79_PANRE